ncbi:DUF5786 family protein [Halosimplex salinum]|uniref:DUF5786 family protein n=1 Tax=Halosimplex salinum TaxID=1710538 RepID=UPI000F4AE151|nr:DUF5786 family protein [Halosimplex salinum]
MGFGSYDESEQQDQEIDTEDDENMDVNARENSHDGKVSFEANASTDDLVGRLEDIKDDPDEE